MKITTITEIKFEKTDSLESLIALRDSLITEMTEKTKQLENKVIEFVKSTNSKISIYIYSFRIYFYPTDAKVTITWSRSLRTDNKVDLQERLIWLRNDSLKEQIRTLLNFKSDVDNLLENFIEIMLSDENGK